MVDLPLIKPQKQQNPQTSRARLAISTLRRNPT
jgi:hypothetical protein